MRRITLLTFVLATYLVSAGLFKHFQAAATCNQFTYPEDQSETLQRGDVDNCGDTNWELIAYFGDLWDEGEYDATGTCTGGYINCNCDNVPLSFKAPTRQFEFSNVQPEEYEWWWVITNYDEPIYNNCTSGACESTGYKSQTFPTFIDENAGWDDENCLT